MNPLWKTQSVQRCEYESTSHTPHNSTFLTNLLSLFYYNITQGLQTATIITWKSWNRVDCQHSVKRSETRKRFIRMPLSWTKQDKIITNHIFDMVHYLGKPSTCPQIQLAFWSVVVKSVKSLTFTEGNSIRQIVLIRVRIWHRVAGVSVDWKIHWTANRETVQHGHNTVCDKYIKSSKLQIYVDHTTLTAQRTKNKKQTQLLYAQDFSIVWYIQQFWMIIDIHMRVCVHPMVILYCWQMFKCRLRTCHLTHKTRNWHSHPETKEME